MQTIYQTHDGDVLDAICAARYGTENLSYIVTQVLEANPGLADRGAVYPSGLLITLPDMSPPVQESAFNLWD
ncbi:tail protein X [Citrobacter sedlakii]|uniref:tail protein X n=1 Tax=Citrobacter TaxID=544 RepID=UPI001969B697|nr:MULTISPECIES: tail protein X [Citrobacter]MBM9567080.1 tail protein X [Citrobacter sedlakii]HBL4692655.1 tail protein X [Citrobacter sedlakii]HBL4707094.1 tail protein X [Citrobacter sedlakii]HBL4718424.1 tail protein X [Citrobacter sedlakii]HCA7839376.1 tail protein X [Citrobacter sedlakii]